MNARIELVNISSKNIIRVTIERPCSCPVIKDYENNEEGLRSALSFKKSIEEALSTELNRDYL